MIHSLQIIVSGKVQGVGYRKFCKAKADGFELTGSVQNLDDGSVEIYVQGEMEVLEHFISLLKIGPLKAEVKDLKITECVEKNWDIFEILQ